MLKNSERRTFTYDGSKRSVGMKQRLFSEVNSLDNALTLMKNNGVQHRWYSHYTSLDKLKLMLASKTIWLTRCSSLRFDDVIEGKKYGTKKEADARYIACFSIGKPESAAMWGLYCPPTYKAIRIVFSKEIMQAWSKDITVFPVVDGVVDAAKVIRNVDSYFSDLIYASVKGDDDDRDRANTISWEGEFSVKIPRLESQKKGARATGRVKDYEWRFEREMRLLVKIRAGNKMGEQIAVRLPDEVIRGMQFTFSPWADDDEKGYVREKVTSWLIKALATKSIGTKFDESMLNNGLGKWATSRGV